MFRATRPDGTVIETDDPATQQALLQASALPPAYCPKDLALRLRISERNAYDLIRNGEIQYVCAGKKNYRISERAVQRYEDGLPPLR
jgi:excisionase family DNA binding protein